MVLWEMPLDRIHHEVCSLLLNYVDIARSVPPKNDHFIEVSDYVSILAAVLGALTQISLL